MNKLRNILVPVYLLLRIIRMLRFWLLLLCLPAMAGKLEVVNLRGSNVLASGFVFPPGSTSFEVPDGSSFTFDSSTAYAGGDSNAAVVLSFNSPGVVVAQTESETYWALYGFLLGVVWGGSAFVYRLVRQAGRQNPEI